MRSKRNTRKKIVWGIIILILVIGVVTMMKNRKGPQPPEIKTATVVRGDITASVSGNGTIKAWSPHTHGQSSSPLHEPTVVGTHSDYVRCLAYW